MIVKATMIIDDTGHPSLPGVVTWINTDHVVFAWTDNEGNTKLHLVSGKEVTLAKGTEYLFRGGEDNK